MSDNAAPPQEHPAATDTTEPEATEVPPSPQGHNSGRISPGNEAGGEEGFVENGSSRDESPDRENYDRDAYGRDRYGQGYDDYDDNDEDEDHYNDHSMEDDGYDDGHEQGYNNHQSMHGYDEDNFRGRMKAEREYADDGYQSRPHNHRVDDSSDNNEKHEKEDQSRRVALANARQRDEFGRFVPGPGKRKAQNQGASDDPTAVVPPKQRKKPGPKPRNPQPLKNDIQAKKLIIRQIEAHWGKDFIKNFIPKVHRPLVKRKKGKARTHNRKHEDDPMKWLPSILKAILSLARLIDDKARLKKVMGDVVRYRNQHTGNKKPQLVTTDFDVIEDIIERGWSVKQSFDIRYKHLLTNRMIAGELDTNSKEQKEYYDHLFRNESDGSSSEEEVVQAYGEDDGDGYGDGADEDMEYELTNDYQLQSGYYDSPPQKPQPPPRQQKSGPPPGYRQPPPRPNPEPARGYRPSSSSQYHRESSPVYRQAPSKQYPPEPVRDYRAPPAPMVRPPPTQGYRKPAPRYDPEDRFELENSFEPSERFMPPGTPRRNEQIRRPEPSRRPPVPGYRGYDAPYNTPDSYNSRGYPMTNRGDFEEPGRHSSYGNMRPPPTPSYTRDTPNDMFQDPNRRPRAPNTPRDNIGSAPIRRNAPPIHPPPHSPSSLDSSPEMPLSRQRPAKRPSNLTSSHLPSSPPPFIKPEPRDNAPILSDDRGSMSPPRRDIPKFQDLRSSSPAPRRDAFAVHKPDMEEYPDSEDELQAQLALAEAEANAAKLRLKMASERNRGRKKGSGVPSGSKGNPVGLD